MNPKRGAPHRYVGAPGTERSIDFGLVAVGETDFTMGCAVHSFRLTIVIHCGFNSHMPTDTDEHRLVRSQKLALQRLTEACPRLRTLCYWAGSAALAIEDLHHRMSFDLDFHTRKALVNVKPILAEIRQAFPGAFNVIQAPDEFGSGFQGTLTLPNGDLITIEVLSNYEDVDDQDLVPSITASGILRVSLARYIADKIQCVAERAEARDLVDISAVLRIHPEMRDFIRETIQQQDAILMTERLLGWTDEQIVEDLAAYDDVNPADAMQAKALLLTWLKDEANGGMTE